MDCVPRVRIAGSECLLSPEQDSDGKHRDFLSLVKQQRGEERHRYVSQLRDQLGEKR